MDQIDKIIAYEQGDLSASETIELFSELVRSGMAWKLQGHYGAAASRLIDAGYINQSGEILKEVE